MLGEAEAALEAWGEEEADGDITPRAAGGFLHFWSAFTQTQRAAVLSGAATEASREQSPPSPPRPANDRIAWELDLLRDAVLGLVHEEDQTIAVSELIRALEDTAQASAAPGFWRCALQSFDARDAPDALSLEELTFAMLSWMRDVALWQEPPAGEAFLDEEPSLISEYTMPSLISEYAMLAHTQSLDESAVAGSIAARFAESRARGSMAGSMMANVGGAEVEDARSEDWASRCEQEADMTMLPEPEPPGPEPEPPAPPAGRAEPGRPRGACPRLDVSIADEKEAALSEALVATLKLPLPSQEARSREASLRPTSWRLPPSPSRGGLGLQETLEATLPLPPSPPRSRASGSRSAAACTSLSPRADPTGATGPRRRRSRSTGAAGRAGGFYHTAMLPPELAPEEAGTPRLGAGETQTLETQCLFKTKCLSDTLLVHDGSEEVQRRPVSLHIYDVSQFEGVQRLNAVLAHRRSPLKLGGVFHAGVEVDGKEWSFGFADGTLVQGVQWTWPREHPDHHYRQTVHLPCTDLSPSEVEDIVRGLQKEFPGPDYDMLRRNCCHFADELCQRLGAGPIPSWVYRLARVGARIDALIQASMGRRELVARRPQWNPHPAPHGQALPGMTQPLLSAPLRCR